MTVKIIRPVGTISQYDPSGTVTVVGSTPLADTSDATYIASVGDTIANVVIGLEILPSYDSGDPITLHMRLSITGDGSPVSANAQIFIATDSSVSNNEIASFTDGTSGHYAFDVPLVDGTIQDFVVPLDIVGFSGITLSDVVTALEAGAFLDINTILNVNQATPAVVTVYNAWIEVGIPPTCAPPLRRYPRPDSLGVGVGRHYPPPATQQSSNRRAGGYY